MPKDIKDKNTSIKEGSGACSLCYMALDATNADNADKMAKIA